MSSETAPEQELLTIEEEMERCVDEDDEVQMLDVDELLAEDPEVLEAQDPPTSNTATETPPHCHSHGGRY